MPLVQQTTRVAGAAKVLRMKRCDSWMGLFLTLAVGCGAGADPTSEPLKDAGVDDPSVSIAIQWQWVSTFTHEDGLMGFAVAG